MTASRARDRARAPRRVLGPALAGLCVIAVVVPTVASAQLQLRRPTPVIENQPATQAPQTAPRTPPRTAPETAPATDGVSPEPVPADITVAPRPLDGAGITVNRLESVDPDAIGLIGEDQGGFPATLWQGAQWPVVSGLMPRLSAGLNSPVLRDMARRLLVTRASVPVGKPLAASFVALRIDRLLAMGDIGNALALLKITPDARQDESLARSRIEALFFDNNNSDACKAVQGPGRTYSGLYWSQAQAFCHALSGAHSRASLIADLLRERENEVEKVFFAAIDALAGAKGGNSPALKNPSALHLAMIRAAGFQLPADIVQSAQASVLRTAALAPNAALDVRLIAAEKAHGIGALTDDELLRFYKGIPFSKAELSGPISTAEESWTPRTRALLVRAAASQNVALAKAEVLRRAWQLGQERDGFAEIAVTSVPVVADIDPAVELLWFAKDAARVLFAAGRTDRALAWYAIVAADRERIEEARDAEAALWPLALLAAPLNTPRVGSASENSDRLNGGVGAVNRAPVTPVDAARLRQWFEARRQADAQTASRQAAAFYTLLEATGRAVPAQSWRALLDRPFAGTAASGNGLNPVWTHSLEAASAGARIGETVLLTTVGAGEAGEKNLRLGDASRMISALRRVGLEAEARRFAVETAMAAGL